MIRYLTASEIADLYRRPGAALAQLLRHIADRLPYWPDPDARCPAHGARFCAACHRNPGDCRDGTGGGCGYWSATGMHWDTCPNRIR